MTSLDCATGTAIADSVHAEGSHVGSGLARASERSAGHSVGRSGLRWSVFFGVLALVSVVLAPFADHVSNRPVWGPYSTFYLLFLAGLGAAGVGSAAMVTWLVRTAPRARQLPFALALVGLPVVGLLMAEGWLGIAGGDVFAWYRACGHVRSPFFGFEVRPNHQWEIAGAVYSTDGDTFRTHSTPRVARDREFLIVVMGGSAVFGYGLNDDETWPVLLEQRLREKFGRAVTVLNAGCNGHNTLQQLFRAYLRVLPLEPDLILHYGAINDVRTDAELNQLIPFPRELVEARSTRDYLRLKNAGEGFYLENSLLLNRIGRRLGWVGSDLAPRYRGAANGESGTATFMKTTDAYLRNLDSLRALCDNQGTMFVPVTFLADRAQLPPPYDRGLERFVSALREDCTERRLPLIDLTSAFQPVSDKSALFFKDHYHPNRRGAAFLAEHVPVVLAPMIHRLLAE